MPPLQMRKSEGRQGWQSHKFYYIPSMLCLRNIGRAGEAHGFVWQLIVLAIEQAGTIAAAARNPPRGVFAFRTVNTRLIGMGIVWLHLCLPLFSGWCPAATIPDSEVEVYSPYYPNRNRKIRALSTWVQGTKNAVPQKRNSVEECGTVFCYAIGLG